MEGNWGTSLVKIITANPSFFFQETTGNRAAKGMAIMQTLPSVWAFPLDQGHSWVDWGIPRAELKSPGIATEKVGKYGKDYE